MKGISVIICCYNSALRLPKTIQHLALQEISEIPVEIIIVNNASTDNTKDVVLAEWNKYETHFSFKIIDEIQSGLTHARERGVNESQYEYIIFCDDDNWLRNDYLQNAFDLMENDPSIGALGGQGEAISDVDFPDWFEDFKSGYAVGQQSTENKNISSRGYVWGAGLVTRQCIMKKVFDKNYPLLLSDRNGNNLSSGGDTEICKRILLLGYHLFYNDSLFFHHYIPHNRLTWEYKKNMFDGFTDASTILNKYDIIINVIKMNRLLQFKQISIVFLKNILRLIIHRRNRNSEIELMIRLCILLKNNSFIKDKDSRLILDFTWLNKK
ncbi:MAG: glycosyltransferase [Fusobacteriaceae bacterium]|jgi:glycosyltransferase involved in cell wall biosynthesis|nr:glycosyltransferase [Fusobacteriaceae bacterium]